MLGPLEQAVRVWGPSVIDMIERCGGAAGSPPLVKLLMSACGDVRLRPAAVKMFEVVVRAGGSAWAPHLVAAMSKTNTVLRLVVIEHVIPAVLRASLGALDALCACLNTGAASSEFDVTLLRLVLVARCPAAVASILPASPELFVRVALLSYSGWLRRYALEAAVALQSAPLVNAHLAWITKEPSQNHRTAASGVLCRWWKGRVGNQQALACETQLAWHLYGGAPHARQTAVCAWLARKKTFASAGWCDLQSMLLEMMCSRYDANRLVCYQLLRDHFRDQGALSDPVERARLLSFSTASIRCIRVRIADGGARLFVLLFPPLQRAEAFSDALALLAKHVDVGQRDFAKAAASFTLHGPLMVLKVRCACTRRLLLSWHLIANCSIYSRTPAWMVRMCLSHRRS